MFRFFTCKETLIFKGVHMGTYEEISQYGGSGGAPQETGPAPQDELCKHWEKAQTSLIELKRLSDLHCSC